MTAPTAILALAVALQGGPRATVQVDVEGVSGELRRNIRAHLSLVQRQSDPELLESTVRALHERAPAEIRQALRPFGYYTPAIQSELLERRSGWLARYRVEPGEPVRYASVDLELSGPGAGDGMLGWVLPDVGVEEGAVLRHPEWERAKATLLNQAAGRGYLDVRITRSRVAVDTTAGTARAVLAVETGPRYRFGEVRFPETPFRRSLLDRYVEFEPGDYFDLDALLTMQRALTSSDYFRLVQVEPRRDEADSLRVPIRVQLEPQSPASYTIGAGYGTDTGVRGTAAWRRRWINDEGHRIQAQLRGSPRAQSFTGQYAIPIRGGPAHRVVVATVLRREAFEGLESRSAFVRLELDHSRLGWREVASVRLAEEWSKDIVTEVVAGDTVTRTRTSSRTLLIPEIVWSRVWGENVLYPRRGYRVQLDVSGASRTLLSDLSFGQALLHLSAARGLHPGGRLLARLNVGATVVDELQALPVSLRLYAGGDQSVRGFSYRSIGPLGPDGTVIGGRHRVVGSLELEQMVIGPFGVGAFTDGGNVFATGADVSLQELEQGAGVGLRWRSPIGLVRVDIAWPVSRPGAGPRLHFLVGGVL